MRGAVTSCTGNPDGERGHRPSVTTYGQSGDRSRSAEAGFHDHLVKPIELDALLESVSRVTGSRLD
jgi:CheY-like chemotaxis protein